MGMVISCVMGRGYIELIIAVIGDLLILGSAFGSNDIYFVPIFYSISIIFVLLL